jgi:hypothetical protein
MLSRPMIAVAAAPATRRQVSATIVMARVKKVSISADRFLENWMANKALPCRRRAYCPRKSGRNRAKTAKDQAAAARS